jgi:deoxyadenosine/deoxycytidine kinase
MTLIYVEGNIGSGKSTLLNYISRIPNVTIIQEPVDKWASINDGNHNILEAFYNNPTKYAHLFQTVIIPTFIESHENTPSSGIVVGERSIDTGYEVFTKAAFDNLQLNTIERAAYNYWYNFMKRHHGKSADGIIYLRTDPSICYKRMKKRARNGEEVIDVKYIEQIHNLHDSWLGNKNDIPVITINNDTDEDWESKLEIISSFIERITNPTKTANDTF